MKQKAFKTISFSAMAALIVMMMAATVVEKLHGTPAAFGYFYHSPLFIALWVVAALCGTVYLMSRGLGRRFATIGLHLSFVIILVGALVTFLSGIRGQVHLRVGEPASAFLTEDGASRALPFSITLESFDVEYYRGSGAASDYISRIVVDDGGRERSFSVSMNHIARSRGYRLYQADYDRDLMGSTLAVSHDPAGVGITYTGYLLLLLSMLGFFFEKDSGFRAVLRRLEHPAPLVAILLLCSTGSYAKTPQNTPRVLPEEVAEEFGDLYVYYNDRIAPLQTQARDYCLKEYGRAGWNDCSAEQVFTGWLFWYDDWKDVPLKLKAKDRGTRVQDEKEYLMLSVASASALKIFPLQDSEGHVRWYSCTDELPSWLYGDYDRWLFVRKMLDVVAQSVRKGDWDEVSSLVGKIRKYQEKTAASVLPSGRKVAAERIYNRISRPMVPFMATISLGLIVFVLTGLWMSRGRRTPKGLQLALAVYMALLLLYLTAVLSLRWYVSGHAPFAGSYSMMMLMAWLAVLAVLLLYRRLPLVQPLGLLLAGFTMLMASMASANPQITHLMPVLQSPLLSIHVLSMMISYTLLGIVALNGIMGVAVGRGEVQHKLRDVSLLILYPAVFLLTFGTFLGAVWANISWGSYWAWDPKETWALVTVLVYAAALHGGSLKAFRNPRFFHWFTVFAFATVLITYFGVNLILGGMHSYA